MRPVGAPMATRGLLGGDLPCVLFNLPPLQGLHLTHVMDEAESEVAAFFADVIAAPGGPHSLERLTLRGPGVGGLTAETICALSSHVSLRWGGVARVLVVGVPEIQGDVVIIA